MNRIPARRPALAVIAAGAAAALAACSGGQHPAAADGSATPSASASASQSASASPTPARRAPGATYPLTGLPVTNAGNAKRPALSVKIDNISAALPQAGLDKADVVTEVLVEGGLTRLMATFQSQNASEIGPIRSARPVDADLLRELRGGYFAYSGADPREIAPVQAHSDALLISWDNDHTPFWTDPHRYAPHQVFSSTTLLYAYGAKRAPHMPAPPHLFSYGSLAKGAHRATDLRLEFSPVSQIEWRWSAAAKQWLRWQDGSPDRLVTGRQIATTNLVVISAAVRGTGIFDDAHNEDPLDVVIGSGKAELLRDGHVVAGRWVRPSYGVPMKLLGPGGAVMRLAPGQTWLEVQPLPYHPRVS